MSSIFIILPDQLFGEDLENVLTCQKVYLIEDPLFFNNEFHPQKLFLHRASMRFFYDLLKSLAGKFAASKNLKPSQIIYVDAADVSKAKATDFLGYLAAINPAAKVCMWRPSSEHEYPNLLKVKFFGLPIEFYDSPGFLFNDYNGIKPGKHNQTAFYKRMRKIWTDGILNNEDQPLGGKWVYDSENRESAAAFAADKTNDKTPVPPRLNINNPYFQEAVEYITTKVNKNIKPWANDILRGGFGRWPITHAEANIWLKDFIQKKIAKFGPFQDVAVIDNGKISSSFLFHSGLSSSINIGLLTPRLILEAIAAAVSKLQNNKAIKMNEWLPSIEGFTRQIIGWREFIHFNYVINYKELAAGLDKSIFAATNKLGEEWWNLKNNDDAKSKSAAFTTIISPQLQLLYYTGYLHHIPRLMIISNWMTLLQVSPRESYNWFMKYFIDAYPWVMLPNIDMSTYMCGLVGTRPYISSSNYIKKMVLIKNDDDDKSWIKEWNSVYYKFINKRSKILEKIYSMKPIVKYWNELPAAKKKELISY